LFGDCATKFAISANLDAAPAVVKAARRSLVMLVALLTGEAVGEILRARKPPLQAAMHRLDPPTS
jgi:hypothetical protein